MLVNGRGMDYAHKGVIGGASCLGIGLEQPEPKHAPQHERHPRAQGKLTKLHEYPSSLTRSNPSFWGCIYHSGARGPLPSGMGGNGPLLFLCSNTRAILPVCSRPLTPCWLA